jgi:hypothetical protein
MVDKVLAVLDPVSLPIVVTPAKAGVQASDVAVALDSRFRGNDSEGSIGYGNERR